MKKITALMLAVLMMFGLLASAPYVYAQESDSDETPTPQCDYPLGYIPDHHILTSTSSGRSDVLYGTLPSSYSSVDKGVVTAIRNQNPYGVCWSFAPMSCLESSLIVNESASADSTDLSELHLIYFAFNRPTDPLGLTAGDGISSSSSPLMSGGNYSIAMHTLTSGIGAVDESVLSYDNASEAISVDSSLAYSRSVKVENVYEVSAGNSDRIKELIMKLGAVGASYYHSDTYYNSTTSAYYNPSVKGLNHAITIVGWDDSYSKDNFTEAYIPTSDGAWLVKNSWGDTWGNSGYFWLSYEDMAFKPYSNETYNSAFAFEGTSDIDKYEYIYQYDGGSADSWTTSTSGTKAANVYTSQRNERISQVSIVTLDENVEYSLQLYRNPADGDPTDGEAMLSSPLLGSFTDAGYHTVNISDEILVNKGESFSAVFTLYTDNNQINLPIDRAYESSAYDFNTAQKANQSYIYKSGVWLDLATSNASTARIKVFTLPPVPIVSEGTCGDGITWTLDEEGTLTISGTGAMANYTSYSSVPWYGSVNNIKKVVIENGVTSVGKYAFYGCSALESVSLPDSVTAISDFAFYGCKFLTEIDLPENVSTIGTFAFWGCSALETVTIPDSVASIGSRAFYECIALKSVTLPDSVTDVAYGAFYGCTALSDVYYGGSEAEWNSISVAADNNSLTDADIYFNAPYLSLSQSQITLTTGESYALSATVAADDSVKATLEWISSDTSVATVDANGKVTAIGVGSATITATAGDLSAQCIVTVEAAEETYDVTAKIVSAASKLYEPWGIRFFATFTGTDIDKITDRGVVLLKQDYFTKGVTAEEFCANEHAYTYTQSEGELGFEAASEKYPNGRYTATLTEGIYSYDISAYFYAVPYAVMEDGEIIYGAIIRSSMESVLNANLKSDAISDEEKAVSTCIKELKESIAAHYAESGVPGADTNYAEGARGETQSAAEKILTAEEAGIKPAVKSAASRLIEPWGIRFTAEYTEGDNIADRGMVLLHEDYYDASFKTAPDTMRTCAGSYIYTESDGTLQGIGNGLYRATLVGGISSKDIADYYYVAPYVVLDDGSYVYGSLARSSMINVLKANLGSDSVSDEEKAVSQDIIDLYNAVVAYHASLEA